MNNLNESFSHSITGIDDLMNAVLNRFGQDRQNFSNSANSTETDILTKLAIVRLSTSQFLGLFNEYGASMTRVIDRLHAGDREMIEGMRMALRNLISKKLLKLNMTQKSLENWRDNYMNFRDDEARFEGGFLNETKRVVRVLGDFNNERNSKYISIENNLNNLSDYYNDLRSNLFDQINDFDADHQINTTEGLL